jgi:hypothetical protein
LRSSVRISLSARQESSTAEWVHETDHRPAAAAPVGAGGELRLSRVSDARVGSEVRVGCRMAAEFCRVLMPDAAVHVG